MGGGRGHLKAMGLKCLNKNGEGRSPRGHGSKVLAYKWGEAYLRSRGGGELLQFS